MHSILAGRHRNGGHTDSTEEGELDESLLLAREIIAADLLKKY
jgi:hypothetical protein